MRRASSWPSEGKELEAGRRLAGGRDGSEGWVHGDEGWMNVALQLICLLVELREAERALEVAVTAAHGKAAHGMARECRLLRAFSSR